MGIEKIIKKSSEIAAVGALVATMAGCQTTGNYQQNTQSSREFLGTPISTIGAYQSRSELQFPAYNIDGRQEKEIISADNKELINWASDNRLDIRNNLSCASGYSIAPNEVVTLKDGSYCLMDLCNKNTYSNSLSSRYGGDGGGNSNGSGNSDGGRGTDAGGNTGQSSDSNGGGNSNGGSNSGGGRGGSAGGESGQSSR